MGELINIEKYEIAENREKDSRVVKIDLTKADKNTAVAILNQVVEGFQIMKGKVGDVDPEKRYYLDLTKEMKEALENGEAWFTEKSANGRPMGQLRHRVDGRNEIWANPDIVVENAPVANNIAPGQVSNAIYQMALQQQMAEVSQQLDEIKQTVENIEEGQLDDRFAKIEAGEKTLKLAYCAKDDDNRNQLIANSITLLQEGSESIKKVIERRLTDFDRVPSKSRAIKLKIWVSPHNYVERKIREFDNIQKCFEYYDRAQRLTAMGCLMMGEPDSMEQVLFDQEEYICNIDTENLKSIEYLCYEKDYSNEWFYTPKKYVDNERLEFLDFANENYNILSLEVSGKQMLEVLSNGKE